MWVDVARNSTSLCRGCIRTSGGTPPNRIQGGELRVMGAVNATTSHKHCYHLECFKVTGPPWLEGVVDVEAEVDGYQQAGELWPAIRARLTNQPQGCLHPHVACLSKKRQDEAWAPTSVGELRPGSMVHLVHVGGDARVGVVSGVAWGLAWYQEGRSQISITSTHATIPLVRLVPEARVGS